QDRRDVSPCGCRGKGFAQGPGANWWVPGVRHSEAMLSVELTDGFRCAIAHRGCRSGDDIRRDLVLDEGDAVAQLQLAFLQPLQPQQIRRRRLMKRVDRCVEIAVLLLQPG